MLSRRLINKITELSGRLSDLNKGLASVKTLGGRIGFALFGAAEAPSPLAEFLGRTPKLIVEARTKSFRDTKW